MPKCLRFLLLFLALVSPVAGQQFSPDQDAYLQEYYLGNNYGINGEYIATNTIPPNRIIGGVLSGSTLFGGVIGGTYDATYFLVDVVLGSDPRMSDDRQPSFSRNTDMEGFALTNGSLVSFSNGVFDVIGNDTNPQPYQSLYYTPTGYVHEYGVRGVTNRSDLLLAITYTNVVDIYPGQLVYNDIGTGLGNTYRSYATIYGTNYQPYTTNDFPWPGEPGDSTNFWKLFVEAGSDGAPGGTGATGPAGGDGFGNMRLDTEWSSIKGYDYDTNSLWAVGYDGRLYGIIESSTGAVPSLATNAWRVLVDKGISGTLVGTNLIYRGSWDGSTADYASNDVVSYFGNTFVIYTNVPTLGQPPAVGAGFIGTDNDYWDLLVSRGSVGMQGPAGDVINTFSYYNSYSLVDTSIVSGVASSTNRLLQWTGSPGGTNEFGWRATVPVGTNTLSDSGTGLEYNGHPLSSAGTFTQVMFGATEFLEYLHISAGTGLSFRVSGTDAYIDGTVMGATNPVAERITANDTSNWSTAFSWGNHASAGYILGSTASNSFLIGTNNAALGQVPSWNAFGGITWIDPLDASSVVTNETDPLALAWINSGGAHRASNNTFTVAQTVGASTNGDARISSDIDYPVPFANPRLRLNGLRVIATNSPGYNSIVQGYTVEAPATTNGSEPKLIGAIGGYLINGNAPHFSMSTMGTVYGSPSSMMAASNVTGGSTFEHASFILRGGASAAGANLTFTDNVVSNYGSNTGYDYISVTHAGGASAANYIVFNAARVKMDYFFEADTNQAMYIAGSNGFVMIGGRAAAGGVPAPQEGLHVSNRNARVDGNLILGASGAIPTNFPTWQTNKSILGVFNPGGTNSGLFSSDPDTANVWTRLSAHDSQTNLIFSDEVDGTIREYNITALFNTILNGNNLNVSKIKKAFGDNYRTYRGGKSKKEKTDEWQLRKDAWQTARDSEKAAIDAFRALPKEQRRKLAARGEKPPEPRGPFEEPKP